MATIYRKAVRKLIPKKARRKMIDCFVQDEDNSRAIGFANPLKSSAPLQEYDRLNDHVRFTIITPAYNCGKYLSDYFRSILRQTFDVSKIQIIVVDDCSTDDTMEQLAFWKEQCPALTILQTSSNSGQSHARNVAIEYAIGDYVTFIDPDDFLEEHYFSRIDQELKQHPDIKIIGTHLVFYREETRAFTDTHPLKHQFSGKSPSYSLPLDDNSPLILSSACAVISRKEIGSTRFDERIKPTFEDAHFMCRYQMSLDSGMVACIPNAYYLYRKRKDKSSTMDRSSFDRRQYNEVLKFGCLDLLEKAEEKFGFVPKMVQNRVLYHVMWIYRLFVNADSKADAALGETMQDASIILDRIASYISPTVVSDFNASRFNYELKLAYLKKYRKPTDVLPKRVYIKRINTESKLIRILEFEQSTYYLDGRVVQPENRKHVCQNFFHEPFLEYDIVEIRYAHERNILSVRNKSNQLVDIACAHSYCVNPSIKYLRRKLLSKKIDSSYSNNGTWIFLDRLDKADDNAEYLYRWIADHHPNQKIKFALYASSPDWQRLEKDGFDLLAYGSKRWEQETKSCSVIISSQFDVLTFNPFQNGYFSGTKKIVTLQHGVTKDNISKLVNHIPFDMFVTSMPRETDSIVKDGSPYSMLKKDVIQAGLPRHDQLVKQTAKTIILIAPTWRRSLFSGSTYSFEVDSATRKVFSNSNFASSWKELLFSEKLRDIAQEHHFSLVLKPHPNLDKFAKAGCFNIPPYITIDRESSYMDLCAKTALLITDYSSLAFDVAYANGLVAYYQFDEEEFFAQQTYVKGYFEYKRDGFGPVASDASSMVASIQRLLNDSSFRNQYRERIRLAFPVRDGNNCKRAYEAIAALFN